VIPRALVLSFALLGLAAAAAAAGSSQDAAGFPAAQHEHFAFQSANRFYIAIRYIDTRTPARTELPFLTLEFRR